MPTKTRRQPQTKRSSPTKRPHLRLVGPDFQPAVEPVRRTRARKAKVEPVPLPHEFFCAVCECEIKRFDADIYLITGHCGPCNEAMSS